MALFLDDVDSFISPLALFRTPEHRIVELGYKRPFVWTWVVAERRCAFHQNFLSIRPENVDGFLDEFGKGHRPRFIVAAH